MEEIVGREEETALLLKVLNSREPELVAVYGRRRVGKTYLVRNVLHKHLAFEMSGIHNESLHGQLENFSKALMQASGVPLPAKPGNWMDAFDMLAAYLTPRIKKQRKVVFIDEFPWLSTPRSRFMQAFEHFWNTWASRQKNLVIVICGSSAAWMIQKVLNNKGGLHNRVTRRLRLLPFTLRETEAFLRARKINLDIYQVLQLYMVMGGIPQYLKEVDKGESAIQAIDRTCFTKEGLLNNEFKNLFFSLFSNVATHTSIIRALAKKGAGLNRTEIIKACNLSSGGGTTQVLDELTESGFITSYVPFGRTVKDSVYKLTDEYSLFYIRFIENTRLSDAGSWVKFAAGPAWKSWSGTAFESICMKHTRQLKKALGIESVHTETSLWRQTHKEHSPGAQIDLLIDRQDMCINICEMKFTTSRYEITKRYAAELEDRLRIFRESTGVRKTLFLTMVTTHGVKNAASYPGLIQSEVNMDALFR